MRRLAALALFSGLGALSSVAQAPAPRAGEVTALLPVAHIERGAATRLAANLRDDVLWRDWFATEAKARARLALVDGSLLNIGSEARVQIVEHDQTTERTELELQYGKVRGEIKKRIPGGKFEVRTDAAVVGVLGTHLYVAAGPDLTTVINFDGQVRVASADPGVPGEEILQPFELAEVEPGQPPRRRLATLQELLQALLDTLPGPVLAGAPQQARPGQCISASVSEAVTGPAQGLPGGPPFPLQLTPRPCGGPDLAPVRFCVPESAPPGAYEYAVQAADGTLRWGALLVQPPAALQDAWLLTVSELPPGATHTGRLVGKDNEPIEGVAIRVRMGEEERVLTTDAAGGFTFQAPAAGKIEIEVNRSVGVAGLAGTPFEAPQPIRVEIPVVEKIEVDDKLPEYAQRGSLVTVKGQLERAQLGEMQLPILSTVTRDGKALSTFAVPRDLPEGARPLELQQPGGQSQSRPLLVYDVLGGRLDQHMLSSGAVTQGDFLVCVGSAGAGGKVKAHITAAGPVHFRGKGAKGKRFEQTYRVEQTGLLRIPFQIQAEKGSPTGIPFALFLRLEGG